MLLNLRGIKFSSFDANMALENTSVPFARLRVFVCLGIFFTSNVDIFASKRNSLFVSCQP